MANCQASADINGDWAVDLSDAICLLYYLFNGLCEPRTFGCGRFPVLGQECVSSLCASRCALRIRLREHGRLWSRSAQVLEILCEWNFDRAELR